MYRLVWVLLFSQQVKEDIFQTQKHTVLGAAAQIQHLYLQTDRFLVLLVKIMFEYQKDTAAFAL